MHVYEQHQQQCKLFIGQPQTAASVHTWPVHPCSTVGAPAGRQARSCRQTLPAQLFMIVNQGSRRPAVEGVMMPNLLSCTIWLVQSIWLLLLPCRNEDFYEVKAAGKCPEYDVLVTNPPFSGDHLERIFRFAVKSNK